MNQIKQNIPVHFTYNVHFTEGIFTAGNRLFSDVMQSGSGRSNKKLLFVMDEGMLEHHPELSGRIRTYLSDRCPDAVLVCDPVVVPGGEQVKNDTRHVERIHRAVHDGGIDRHSFIVAIGGGAVLDMAGYAAATAHRGIRLIRVPTTVLSQNDGGIGVKNGINAFGKKNFLGTFQPPFAVINDYTFLDTLDDRDWKAGIPEALKVALLRDATFFEFLDASAEALVRRDRPAMHQLVYRCAGLHLDHIAHSGDPFESGSSRPLDFGHWAGHKLEQMTRYKLRHGEAVAIGLALDCTYSMLSGLLPRDEWGRIIRFLENADQCLFVPELAHKLDQPEHPDSLFHGLEEFREHLGGELTIMLLQKPGQGTEVHSVDYALYREAVEILRARCKQPA